ncbi:MAG: TMEM143 family protein [Caldilineaceae bacterium]
MAASSERESFIPYTREELIDLCIDDGRLTADEVIQFRAFCELLAAHANFRFHALLETLKSNYAPFDPDAVTHPDRLEARRDQGKGEAIASDIKEDRFVDTLRYTLECANYRELDDMAIHEAIENAALIDLRAEIDFDDFDHMVFYYRGAAPTALELTRYYFWKKKVETAVFDQVVLGIKFKDAGYFHGRKVKVEKLNFTPGLMYLYMYRNIPKYDLELLFPNVKLHMNLVDRLLFILPALGAGISVIYKISSSILLIVGLLILLLMGPAYLHWIGLHEEQIQNYTPVLFAFFSLSVALGGFAVKQYFGYQNRRMKYMKDVMDTLFFKNRAANASVFHTVIDAAEEEETKEIILVYYHLLTHHAPLTPNALDARIEAWLAEKDAPAVNFDIEHTMQQMQALRATCPHHAGVAGMADELVLARVDEQGCCHVLPLVDAKRLLDNVWDNAFQYA